MDMKPILQNGKFLYFPYGIALLHALAVYSRQELSNIQPSDIHTSCVFQIKTVHCAEFMQIDGQTAR